MPTLPVKQRAKVKYEDTRIHLGWIRTSYKRNEPHTVINMKHVTKELIRVMDYWGIQYKFKLQIRHRESGDFTFVKIIFNP